MKWYHVWWFWLISQCVARVCHHQLSFLFATGSLHTAIKDLNLDSESCSFSRLDLAVAGLGTSLNTNCLKYIHYRIKNSWKGEKWGRSDRLPPPSCALPAAAPVQRRLHWNSQLFFRFCWSLDAPGKSVSIVVPYEIYDLYDWGNVPELYGTL